MIKRFLSRIIILISLLLFISCGSYAGFCSDNISYNGNYVRNRAKDLKFLDEPEINNLPSEYDFVVIADLHYGSKRKDAPGVPSSDFIKWLSDILPEDRPKFCLSLGDVADCGYEEQYLQYSELVAQIEALGVKVFNTVGNHDLYQSGWDYWKENCYPSTSFYKFKTNGYSLYSIDTGTGTLGPVQLELLKKNMEEDPAPKIIFTHYPLYTDTFFFNFADTTDRNLMTRYFADNNVKLYLAGHLHWLEEHDFGTFQSYAIPSLQYKGQWVVFHINEKTETYDFTVISK